MAKQDSQSRWARRLMAPAIGLGLLAATYATSVRAQDADLAALEADLARMEADFKKLTAGVPSGPPIITLAEFNALRDGMTVSEARRIIGAQGQLSSSSTIGDIVTSAYTWQNPNGSNAMVMFQNDKLVMRTQFGLP